jgi:predicted ATPase
MRRAVAASAPFLKRISILGERIDRDQFPFDRLAFLNDSDFALDFPMRVTFFVGENGSGKSTVLEAIAALCEFPVEGGTHEHQRGASVDGERSRLAEALRPSWLPRVRTGAFLRAESFFNLAGYIDTAGSPVAFYGGRELHAQSHGESVMALLTNRLRDMGRAIILMDEPEAALSPSRQLALLSLLHEWDMSGKVQVVIATHSPILLCYPGATLYQFGDDGIHQTTVEQTEHFRLTRAFLSNPERYLANLFGDRDDDDTPRDAAGDGGEGSFGR